MSAPHGSAYQSEQLEALILVRDGLALLDGDRDDALRKAIEPYLWFRQAVDAFLKNHFEAVCTAACYQDRRSACCSKDGIITFFADHVINALAGGRDHLAAVEHCLRRTNTGTKCTYLTPEGCCWRVRPLVCAMFLCDGAQEMVFQENPEAASRWQELELGAKRFRWPDRPVLFDALELAFIEAGCRSPLMYLNFSPGLIRVKQGAGLPLPAAAERHSQRK
jgi:hypothetical protein